MRYRSAGIGPSPRHTDIDLSKQQFLNRFRGRANRPQPQPQPQP